MVKYLTFVFALLSFVLVSCIVKDKDCEFHQLSGKRVWIMKVLPEIHNYNMAFVKSIDYNLNHQFVVSNNELFLQLMEHEGDTIIFPNINEYDIYSFQTFNSSK